MKKKPVPVNCLGCGRDTLAISGYCFRCIGTNRNKYSSHVSERKDRKIKNVADRFIMDSDGFYDDFEDDNDMQR